MTDQTLDQKKVAAVGDYLQGEFPGCSLEVRYHPERRAMTFRVSDQDSTYLASVTREFLDDHEAPVIGPKLTAFTLAEHMRALPSQAVIVTTRGLELEY